MNSPWLAGFGKGGSFEGVKDMEGMLAWSGKGAREGKYLDVGEMRLEDYSVIAYSPHRVVSEHCR